MAASIGKMTASVTGSSRPIATTALTNWTTTIEPLSSIQTVIWSTVSTSEMKRDGIPLCSSSSRTPLRRSPSNIRRRRLWCSLPALR